MARRPGALRFAVSRSNAGASLLDGARRFAAALDERLGLPVDVVITYDYAALLKALTGGGAELAWMPPLVHARATAAGARLVALSQRGAALGYRAALVVHVDSRFRSLADVVGVRAAWIDRASASGYVVPRQLLAAHGVDLAKAFRSERFYGSSSAACRAVVDGDADLSACFVRTATDVAAAQAEVQRSVSAALRVFALTGPIPPDGVALAPSVDATQATELRQVLLDLHARPSGRDALMTLMQAERLAPVPDEIVRALERLVAG